MADIVLNVEEAMHFDGYVISALAYESEHGSGEDIEAAESLASDISGEEHDSERDGKAAAVQYAKELITDPSVDRVSIEVDGSWWKSYEKPKPKARKPRAKKSNPAQQSLFGSRRR
jgi:hypothetical protein